MCMCMCVHDLDVFGRSGGLLGASLSTSVDMLSFAAACCCIRQRLNNLGVPQGWVCIHELTPIHDIDPILPAVECKPAGLVSLLPLMNITAP